MSLVKVVVVGCSGVGKKNLSRELMKHMADGPPVDYEEPGVDQIAVINGQRTLIVIEDVYLDVAASETDDPNASLLPKGGRGGGSSARFLRGAKAPIKKVSGPKLRKKESVFDKAKIAKGLEKAKAVGALKKESNHDDMPTGTIVVFDIGSTESFEEAERQLQKLQNTGAPQHVVLVGNKTDKRRALRRVTYEEGLRLTQLMKSIDVVFIETSAKLYQKVDQVFIQCVKKIQSSLARDNSTASGGAAASGAAGEGGASAGADEAGAEGGEEKTKCLCCTKYCKCCPRPIYKCLKACDNCCVMM